MVNYLTADEERWHEALVHDELGVVEDKKIQPWWQGLQVGISFVIGGLIPTIPVLFSLLQTRWWAYGLTALSAMGLGAIKARYIQKGRSALVSNFWEW
jgi:VIT1/CCC1 family predicted Fe2+/Mn2+ transporter